MDFLDRMKTVVTFEDQASPGISKLEKNLSGLPQRTSGAFVSGFGQANAALEGMIGKLTAFSVAGYGLTQAFAVGARAMKDAADFSEVRGSLNSLAAEYETTADVIIQRTQDATAGLVAMKDIAEIAGSALKKNLSPEQLYEIAGAAETLSNVAGEDVTSSFRSLAEAIALGRERALESSLGVIDLSEKYGALASTMTDSEKTAARYEIVMERVRALQGRLGEGTDSLADKYDRFGVMIEDMRIQVGMGLNRALAFLVGVFKGVEGATLAAAAGIFQVQEGLYTLGFQTERARGAALNATAAWDASRKALADQAAAMDVAINGMRGQESAMGRVRAQIDALRIAEDQRQAGLKKGIADATEVANSWRAGLQRMTADHDKLSTEIEQRERQHNETMKQLREVRLAGEEALRDLTADQRRPGQSWVDDQVRAEKLLADAMAQADPEKQAEGLRDYIALRKTLTAGISQEALDWERANNRMEAFGRNAQTDAEARAAAAKDVGTALQLIDGLQSNIAANETAWREQAKAQHDELTARMETAKGELESYLLKVRELEDALAKGWAVKVDASEALTEAKRIKDAIDAIPATTYKTIVVDYVARGNAPSVLPGPRGSEGTRTAPGPGAAPAPRGGAPTGAVVHIGSVNMAVPAGRSPREAAREFERELAARIRSGRSALSPAVAGVFAR